MRKGNETELLYEVSCGDGEAFADLFNIHKNITYTYALKVCQSTVLAEEVVQDVFMKIWISRERLAVVENFGAYLRVVTRNEALQVLRRLAAEARCHAGSAENWNELHNETESSIDYRESRQILDKALETLPPQQKLIYQLCHVEGMKQREVAEQLHISPLTVKAHLKQAVTRIRALVKMEYIAVFCFIASYFNLH